MKRAVLSIVSAIVMVSTALASDNGADNTVYISGRITTNTDSVNLLVGHWKNYITGVGQEQTVTYIPINKDGRFKITLTGNDHPGRAQIMDALSNNVLFDNSQIVEPGDSIYVTGTIRDQPEFSELNFVGKFTGRGAAKYNCIQALKLVNDVSIRDSHLPTPERIRLADSIIKVKEGILIGFKEDINPDVYQIIHADIIGSIKYTVLLIESDLSNERATNNNGRKALLKEFISEIPAIPEDLLAESVGYTSFLYLKEKQGPISEDNKKPQSLEALYLKIRTDYSGKLREKLIAVCLLNDYDMSTLVNDDSDAYTSCLSSAVALVKTGWLKAPLEKLLNTRGKGAQAFDFVLPADSSSVMVRLSDLKGKVVLVDMWGFICTGCYRFAGAFHKKVYPIFKDNPDFKVVSIMLDQFAGMEQYKQRLRGQNGPVYTFPDYTNLYAGKGETMGRAIEEHYNIRSFPFILLIDKHGRIYSSTVPFMDSADSPNVDKLIALIKNALNEI